MRIIGLDFVRKGSTIGTNCWGRAVNQINPSAVRYIKLGQGGRWEKACFDRAELQFGHQSIPHELALTCDREQIKRFQIGRGISPQAAADDAREVTDFYTLGRDCLWITFARDHLWWTFCEPDVTWVGGDWADRGERSRKCVDTWRNTDIKGVPLRMDSLSTKLTKVASYRRTLCTVEAEEYLLRRINGVIEPIVERSNHARDAVLQILTEAIPSLHWVDFETFADVIFTRSGWHRSSPIGGTQKTVDLVIEHPVTNERAAVQVKSMATQDLLDQFIDAADQTGRFHRLFFICHSPKGALAAPVDRADVHLWSGRELAKIALRVGLFDWVIEKTS
jgi:Restriction endonuclease